MFECDCDLALSSNVCALEREREQVRKSERERGSKEARDTD